MRPTDLPSGIGCAIIERQLLDDLATLWFGPLSPERLERIERALRAILTSTTLVAARFSDPWKRTTLDDAAAGSVLNFEMPFSDDVLDCEFLSSESAQPIVILDDDEGSYLDAFVAKTLQSRADEILPKWITRMSEALAYLDAWCEGEPQSVCEGRARKMVGHDEDFMVAEPFTQASIPHPIFANGLSAHARYFVGCQRAGAVVYGDSPVATLCEKHLFSRWPEELFRRFGVEHARAMRELRGPGICIDVPPLIGLVLSRANRRHQIPEAIRDLRKEYERERAHLWQVLTEMWSAPTLAEQMRILRRLEDAANSMFTAAFPERFDVLSLGLGLAPLGPGALAGVGKQILEAKKATIRVSSISLARKLARDYRKDLLNSRASLVRHLTADELRDFGM